MAMSGVSPTPASSTQRRQAAIEDLRRVGGNGARRFTEEEWAFFFGEEPAEEPARNPRWYSFVVFALCLGMLATSALIAWRVVLDGRNDIRDPAEVELVANRFVEESPLSWLVTDLEVLPIQNIDIGGFVRSGPADGIIAIDARPWDERELAEVVHHEIGHLLDFAAYRGAAVPRGGLESEVWAECAAVAAGVRDLDDEDNTEQYRCTPNNFTVYKTAISLLGEVCRPWGERVCGTVPPVDVNP